MIKVYAEIDDTGKKVRVKFPFDHAYVLKIRNIPTRKYVSAMREEDRYNEVKLDLTIMRRLREEFGKALVLGPKLKEWGREQVREEHKLKAVATADDAALVNISNNLKWDDNPVKKLRPYQRADIRFMSERSVINANQPGAGKTAEVVLALAEATLLHGYHLVNAPLNALRLVWEPEIEALYKALKLDPPTILTGDTPAERRSAIRQAKELYDEGYSFWLLLNPALIRKKKVEVYEDAEVGEMAELDGWEQMNVTYDDRLGEPQLLEIDWTSFTIDEFHLMGLTNPQTQGHKGCQEIRKETKPTRLYVLSGTPIQGKPIKLWGALHFLYPERFTSKWNWADMWLDVDKESGRGAQIGGILPGREEDFYDEHKPYLVRRTSREALPGLPEKNRIPVWCDMTTNQAEQYRTFAAEAEWRLDESAESHRITATNILAEYTRLKQFADAFCEVHEDLSGGLQIRQTPDSGKLDQLLERLGEEGVLDSDLRRPALIFSQFNAMVEMVCEVLQSKGVRANFINGTVKKPEARAIARQFQDEKVLDVLVMNTKGGTALNFPRAESAHLLDETWTPDDQEQCEDRAFGGHRAVGKDPGRIYYYRTKDSIEELIQDVCRGKAINNKLVLDLRSKTQEVLDVRS